MQQRNHLPSNRLKKVLIPFLTALLFHLVAPPGSPATELPHHPTNVKPELAGTRLPATNNIPVASRLGRALPQDQDHTSLYRGGKAALDKYLKMNIRYPAEALKNKQVGQATILVTIDEQGRPGNFQTLQTDNPYFEKEALRVLKGMPKWKPAAEPFTLAFPFIFGLNSEPSMPALKVQEDKSKYELQEAIVIIGYGR